MNNYCTNCGKKLEKDELVCRKCNTPIVNLPNNYNYESPRKEKLQKKLLTSADALVLLVVIIFLSIVGYNFYKINRLQKNYVEPYLVKHYSDKDYSIKYSNSGRCIISGDCDFDPVMGCDGGACEEYKYSDEILCKSYYYTVEMGDDVFTITVYHRNGVYSVVEGKNINGTDASDDIDYNDAIKSDSKYNNDYDNSNKVIVDEYPYESDYYIFNSPNTNNQLVLDKNGTVMNFFTGILSDKSNLYISGNIANPKFFKGRVYMDTRYYDKNYNELGKCGEIINLLGRGYSNISFSCHIPESEMIFDDVSYYKVYISAIEIE